MEAAPMPLRVLVKGASTPVWTATMYGPRNDLAYPRVIEQMLFAAGVPADVRNRGVAAERAKSAFNNFDEDVLQWSPDVVIVHYGHYECMHLFLPWRLERYFNGLKRRPGPIHKYRSFGLRKVWKAAVLVQAKIDARLDPDIRAGRPRRVVRDVERVISRTRAVGSPLVLVPDFPPPGKIWHKWWPGGTQRVLTMNAALEGMVAMIGQTDVRMFPVTAVLADLIEEEGEALPDGAHFTARGHRLVGEAMAEVILDWLQGQTHLAIPRRAAAYARSGD